MALGCVLWVLWICFLHLPAIKGYRYASKSDSLNMGGDADDEVMHSVSSDDWRDSNGQAGPAYTKYNKPSTAQKAGYVPTRQAVPSAPEVERLVNGEFRDWSLENINAPLVFPLRPISKPSDPAKPQTGPILSQPSLNADSSNASPNTGGAFQSGSPNAEPVPSYPYQGAKTPSYNSWQPDPVNVRYGVAGSPTQYSNTGSSTHEGDPRQEPHLVFEDFFQYPSNTEQSPRYDGVYNTAGGSGQASYGSNGSPTEYSSEPSFPSYPANAGGQHVLPPRKGSSFFSQTSDQPHDEKTPVWLPQKTVIQTQRVSEPIRSPPPPPPPPSTYIIQSRNGYRRARYLLNKSSYSKELSPPIPIGSMDVKGPAKGQPAAIQRTKG